VKHRSNDPHVLKLAIASGARVLATSYRALMADFKNPKIIKKARGRIYSGHTSSCGVKAK
jgi:hypothetical protein